MRILVQDSASRTFFDGLGWDKNAERAKSFESVTHAETFCRNQNLNDALIVVRFNNPKQEDVCYPMGPHSALVVSKGTTRIRSIF